MSQDRQKDQGKPVEGVGREEAQRRGEEGKYRGKRFRRYKQYGAKDPNRPSWTPWLLIRGSLADLGVRPLPLPASFHWWTSPDIWIEPHGHIVANEDNFVHVRIFNLGMADAIPVKVDFYWASPAISLSSATVNLIGTEWVEIPALTSKEVRCKTPHMPVSPAPIFTQTLIVNCSNPVLDPITNPFQPNLDRHVGPYSLAVIPATPERSIEFSLDIHNPFSLEAKMSISAQIEHVFVTDAAKKLNFTSLINHVVAYGAAESNVPQEMMQHFWAGTAEYPRAERLAKRALSSRLKKAPHYVRGFREVSHPVRSAARIMSELSDYSCIVKPDRTGQYLGNLLLAMDKLNSSVQCFDTRRDIRLQDVKLKPFEQRRLALELEVPANAKAGEYVVFHLSQRAEGMLIGGYTVVAQVVEHGFSDKSA